MPITKRMLIGGVIAAVTMTVTSVGPANAGPSDKGQQSSAPGAVADERFAPDRQGRQTIAASPAAASALERIQKQISDYVAKNGTKYSFASYWDSVSGKMVLETDAPADTVAAVTKLTGVSAEEQRSADRMQVRSGTTTRDQYHRRDDIPAFWGGAGIAFGGGICSSGYAVRNVLGLVFMTTAGHCFGVGSAVRTESGANLYGVVLDRRLPTWNNQPRDVETMNLAAYSGRIYTGGVTSTSSVPVFSAGEASVGFNNYCHSGRTSGEACGHTANSITGQVCTQTGCKQPVIVWTGGVQSAGGDSGSPFYVMDSSGRAWIRGHVIAGNGTTSFSEKWTAIAPLLGVTIVTG